MSNAQLTFVNAETLVKNKSSERHFQREIYIFWEAL